MTRQEAAKRLGKMFGKKAGYRVTDNAPNAIQREKAGDAIRALKTTLQEHNERMDQLRAFLLSDENYQDMVRVQKELKKALGDLSGMRLGYKFTAGYVSSMGFFHVEAQGDTWEEVFSILNRKYPSGKAAVI